jgi:phospholipid transport system substrate-binding protein
MHKLLILFIFSLFAGIASAAEALVAPDVLARSVTDEVLATLRTDKAIQAGDQKKARDLIETKIAPHFNFAGMTQLAVGKNWSAANPEQRKALVGEFRALLVQTYTASLTLF